MALEKELETYRNKLAELAQHEGKYVLIHGDKVEDFFQHIRGRDKGRLPKIQIGAVLGETGTLDRTSVLYNPERCSWHKKGFVKRAALHASYFCPRPHGRRRGHD